MRIMITGAGGFMGRNLCETLRERRPEDTLDLMDLATPRKALEAAAAEADFVFHLAGVNRPEDPDDFMRGNGDFTLELTALLERGKKPPVVLASSIQAALDNPYGASKRAAEDAVAAYARRCGTRAYLYRLPNVFGKWSRPNYNSVVATFCHNIARGLPITVNDPAAQVPLVYIDDRRHRCRWSTLTTWRRRLCARWRAYRCRTRRDAMPSRPNTALPWASWRRRWGAFATCATAWSAPTSPTR